ncbi:MAG: L,D-transpeptidase family protein [bacterium]|nr:L,D-transpeptidase family protein [bacterium]
MTDVTDDRQNTPKIAIFFIIFIIAGAGIWAFFSASSSPAGLYINGQELSDEVTVINTSNPSLALKCPGFPIGEYTLRLDGQKLSADRSYLKRNFTYSCAELEDGKHTFSAQSKDLSLSKDFIIDTTPPEVKIFTPAPNAVIGKTNFTFQGKTEPNLNGKVKCGKNLEKFTSSDEGIFTLPMPCVQGENKVTWKIWDKAGNSSSGEIEFLADATLPIIDPVVSHEEEHAILVAGPKDTDCVFSVNSVKLSADVKAESPIKSLEYVLDSGKPKPMEFAEGTSTHAETDLNELAEGLHDVSVIAANAAGLKQKRTITFLIDSTEEYGKAILMKGATGQDVTTLQERLNAHGYLNKSDITGTFDEATVKAVKDLQRVIGQTPDGIVGPLVMGALGQRLYVNLARFEVILVNDDGSTHTYGICTGTSDHPTPTGTFFIADKAKNPDWLPPDTEWAKDAKPAPPGPDNPLGTRWIGLNIGSIGFHGTPYPWTVGTMASHGCMRMRLADVEDLYDRVSYGAQVTIFSGNEDNPILHRYWP